MAIIPLLRKATTNRTWIVAPFPGIATPRPPFLRPPATNSQCSPGTGPCSYSAQHSTGRAQSLVGVFCNLTSASRRRTSPGRTSPPPLFQRGNSSSATVLGLSSALRRSRSVDEPAAPQPTLNAQLTRAPYWFAFKTTSVLVSMVMHC